MSKAKDRALKAYPKKMAEREGYDEYLRERKGFIRGYCQAEKDLELTWEDIETILNIENDILHECNSRIQLLIEMYPTAKDYYQEILKQFKERKKNKL